MGVDRRTGWARAADGVGGAEDSRSTGTGRPTSRDVARLAGVSHTAVSFVFNGRAEGRPPPRNATGRPPLSWATAPTLLPEVCAGAVRP